MSSRGKINSLLHLGMILGSVAANIIGDGARQAEVSHGLQIIWPRWRDLHG